MTNSSPSLKRRFLIERASPGVRRLLVKQRVQAMNGRLDESLTFLNAAINILSSDQLYDRIAIALLSAELLHLELRDEESVAIMKKEVTPHLASLPPEERFGIEQNLSDILFPLHPIGYSLFYNVVDQRQMVNFDWLDYRELFEAKQEAEGGNHFKALPILWQQHRRAYLHGCWRVRGWTHGLLARECVQLNQWEDAVHNVVFAPDDQLVKAITAGIIAARQPELVERVVTRLLTVANLRTHFAVACKLFKELADVIPEHAITAVGNWLLDRGKETRTALIGINPVWAAWEAIRFLAFRFPIDLAKRTIEIALSHPIWTTKLADSNRVIVERETIVRAMIPLTESLPTNDIPAIAEAALPLLTDRPQISDYEHVARLLCHLADRGGVTVKEKLALSLYPSGKPMNRILAQAASFFGKGEMLEVTRLQASAGEIAEEITRQVQWLRPGESPKPVAEVIMEYSNPMEDRTLKVYVTGLAGLHALARNRDRIGMAQLKVVIGAVLRMAAERDNVCSNRQALLHALMHFADFVDVGTRRKVLSALEAIAKGPVEESAAYPTAEQMRDPLNPFKNDSGRPEDVQSMALVAMATFAKPGKSTKRAVTILEQALCDERPSIRQAAYSAAWRLATVSDGVILGVLAGLRDPDPNAAGSAFAAVANQTSWKLNVNHWRIFLMAARLAVRTGSPIVRRYAARALFSMSSICPALLRAEHEQLLTALRNDVCSSIRVAATRRTDHQASR
ncbi:MAG TPA: hypothetical protein VFE62_19175 [Gemmataceae bacterium]|nr:hypothetical protein [Gemmataceae bacterium]